MNHVSILLIIVLMGLISCEPSESPIKIRVNSDLIKKIIHKRDEQFLDLFKNISLGSFEIDGDTQLHNMNVSFIPIQGTQEEYDHYISFNEDDFLGIECRDIKFVGRGDIVHSQYSEEFQYESPIQRLRIVFELEATPKMEFGQPGKTMKLKEILFKVDKDQIHIQATGESKQLFDDHQHAQQIKQWIVQKLAESIYNIKDAVFTTGEVEYLTKIPAQGLLPTFFMFYTTFLSEEVKFTDDQVYWGLSPRSLDFINQKKYDGLKNIESKFLEEKMAKNEALEFIIDENAFNAFAQTFTNVDKMYSFRDFISMDQRLAVLKTILSTTMIGTVIPSFKQEYGEGRNIDLVGTLSHDFIEDKIENINPSGLQMDKNGNVKITLNGGAQVVVEQEDNNWVDARNFFFTITVKFKMQINNTVSMMNEFGQETQRDGKFLIVAPKLIELSMFKIFKDSDEMFLEEMLVQTLVNSQIENLRQYLQPIKIPMKNMRTSPEMQCLGFTINDCDIIFKKNQLYVKAYYEDIQETNSTFCRLFEEAIKQGPMNRLKNDTIDFSDIGKYAEEWDIPGFKKDSDEEEEEELVDLKKQQKQKSQESEL